MPMVALFPVCGFYTSTPDVRSKSIVFTRRWRFLCPTCGFYIYTISDRAEPVMAHMPIVLVISDMWFLYAHGWRSRWVDSFLHGDGVVYFRHVLFQVDLRNGNDGTR